MRKFFITLSVMLITMAMMIPVASAQVVSECDGFADTQSTFPVTGSGEFAEGDTLVFIVTGTGDFTVSAGGTTSDVLAGGESFEFSVTADGIVDYSVDATGTGSVEVSCEEEAEFDGTICHIPPGNPAAAHTITVGSESAVEAHLGHGDIGGPCIDGIETRSDFPSIGITIFIIYGDNTIQLFGDCDSECDDDFLEISIEDLINFNLIVIDVDGDGDDDEFIEVDDPEEYGFTIGEISADGLVAVLFYLHPDPDNPNVGVFQLNLFDDGLVVDGSTLIFISASGDIVLWTGQDFWEKLLDDDDDDDDDS